MLISNVYQIITTFIGSVQYSIKFEREQGKVNTNKNNGGKI